MSSKRPRREGTAGIIIPSKDFATLPKRARQIKPKNKTRSQDDDLLRFIEEGENIVSETPVEEREQAQRPSTIIELSETETSQGPNPGISSSRSDSSENQTESSKTSSQHAQKSAKSRSHQSGKYALIAFSKNAAGKSYSCVCGATATPTVSKNGTISASNFVRHLEIKCTLRGKWKEIVQNKLLQPEDKLSRWESALQNQTRTVEKEKRNQPDVLKMLQSVRLKNSLCSPILDGCMTVQEFHVWNTIVSILDNCSFSQIMSNHRQSLYLFCGLRSSSEMYIPIETMSVETSRIKWFPIAVEFAHFVAKESTCHLHGEDLWQKPIASLATDGWSSRFERRCVGLVASHIKWNEQPTIQTRLLSMRPMSQMHSISNLKNVYKDILQKTLPGPRIGGVTTDNASNESMAGYELGTRLPCFAHTIQLYLKKHFFKHPLIRRVTLFPLKVVSKFSKSVKRFGDLQRLNTSEQPLPRPPKPIATRWWSDIPVLQYYRQYVAIIRLAITSPDVDTRVKDRKAS